MNRPLLVAVAVTVTILGVFLAGAGWRGVAEPAFGDPRSAWGRSGVRRRLAGFDTRRVLVALGAGLVVLAVTGWVVAAAAAGVGALALPRLLSGRNAGQARIARLEGLEAWTRRLADVLSAHAGLEQALATSVRTPPAAISPELRALGAHLAAHWAVDDALRALAHDLDDQTADFVVSALLLASTRRGARLARALTGLADTVAEEVAMRRAVEADRAKPRTTARWITYITLGFVAVGMANRAYTAPFGTPLGQGVLAVAFGIFALGFGWTWRLAHAEPRGRLLHTREPT